MVLFVGLAIAGAMGGNDERYIRFEVPNSKDLPNLAKGEHVLYMEFDRSPDNKNDLRPPGIERLTFTLSNADTGEVVPLRPSTKIIRYAIRRIVGESLYEFNLPAQGTYRLDAAYEPGVDGGAYRVAVGRPYGKVVFRYFTGGFLLLIGAGFLISYILHREIRRNTVAPDAARD